MWLYSCFGFNRNGKAPTPHADASDTDDVQWESVVHKMRFVDERSPLLSLGSPSSRSLPALPRRHPLPKDASTTPAMTASVGAASHDDENIATMKFRQYLRIRTVHPHPDYAGARLFLKNYADELKLDFHDTEVVAGKPICVLTWKGSQPDLDSVMLNSHMDVVPVSESNWNHDPFEAVKLPNGDIVARGAQDMKCVGIQYLEAIRILKASGYKPIRTFHVTFVPDEEVSGEDGMMAWVKTDHFKSLRVGFALDEGLANATDAYKVYYGERVPWWMRITARGGAGHASQFIEPSATIRLLRTLQRFADLRDSEQRRLSISTGHDGRPLTLGDVTTTNITLMNCGLQFNVVPEVASAGVDMRVPPSIHLPSLRTQIEQWCKDDDTTLEFAQVQMINVATSLDETKNPWWRHISIVAKTRRVRLEPEIFPAATDSRFLRELGIPAIGISPIRNTPVLLHDHNEFLNEAVFLEGVGFYVDVLPGLSGVPETQ